MSVLFERLTMDLIAKQRWHSLKSKANEVVVAGDDTTQIFPRAAFWVKNINPMHNAPPTGSEQTYTYFMTYKNLQSFNSTCL